MKLFNNPDFSIDNMIEYIKENTSNLVPFFSSTKAVIGSDTVMLLVSFTPKETWKYGYVENSPYFRMCIESDGTMEVFTASLYKSNQPKTNSTRIGKFRKYTAKNRESVIKKLVEYIDKIKIELEHGTND